MRKSADRYRKSLIGIAAVAVCAVSAFGSEHVLGASMTDGTYTVGENWSEDTDLSTETEKVYKKAEMLESDETSTISCSFIDTNYTAMDYEQLRDMLTNNLIYSSPNASISVSATYTDAKDYLYVLVADDSAQNYREIYYYVVGDMECFVAEVKEYREEAQAASENAEDTPEAVGAEIAKTFVWTYY